MNFTGKLNASMAKMGKTMKNGVDNCKLDGKIAEQQKRIRVLTKEIGNLTLVRLDAGDEMSPEVMERFEAIKEARAEITALESGRKKTNIACPKCGVKTAGDMRYCGKCGADMKENAN